MRLYLCCTVQTHAAIMKTHVLCTYVKLMSNPKIKVKQKLITTEKITCLHTVQMKLVLGTQKGKLEIYQEAVSIYII